jgi:hypothetical protein
MDRILIAAAGLLAPQLFAGQLAATLRLGSASLDPWADARLAIDEFAARLAVACRDLPRAAKQSRHAPQGGVGPSLTRTRS